MAPPKERRNKGRETGQKENNHGTWWTDGERYGWSSAHRRGRHYEYHEHSFDEDGEEQIESWEWDDDD